MKKSKHRSTEVVIPPDQPKRKCLRSTHYWLDVIIVLMKKCSLADKKLKTFLFDAMRIEYRTIRLFTSFWDC